MSVTPSVLQPVLQSPIPDYSGLIDAIGKPDFGRKFAAFLHESCGAEHCAIFRINLERIQGVTAASVDGTDVGRQQAERYVSGQYWRRDPAVDEALRSGRNSPVLIRLDPRKLRDRTFRDTIYFPTDICERLLLSDRRADAMYSISMLRSNAIGAFSERAIADLQRMAPSLIALSAKHSEIICDLGQGATALSTVPVIEQRMRDRRFNLTLRELQVTARILFGMTMEGIALDLGIKKESVVTYRKRGYMKLNIATRHELMRLYLQVQ